MPKKTQKQPQLDIFEAIATGLKRAALKPNIHAYEPHEKQLEFHSSSAAQRLFIGGNRSGKTVAGACEAVMYATGKHKFKNLPWEPPLRLRVVSVDFLNGVEKIVKPEIARWCPISELKNNSWEDAYDRQLRTLTFENESFIEFMSYDQDLEKFAGTSRHGIWFDEEPPRSIYHENKMRLVDVGGHVWTTMTPVEGMTWTFEEIYEAASTDKDIHVVEVDMAENPHLGEAEQAMLLSGFTEEERDARKRGKYVSISGLIYKNFDVSKHVKEFFIPDKSWMHFRMMDHGFNNNTAWLWGAVDRDGRIVIYNEHVESGKVVAYHANVVKKRTEELGVTPYYSVGDPSIRNRDPITGTSIQLEYIEHDIPIILGNNDVDAGIIRVAGMLGGKMADGSEKEPSLFITENCVETIKEFKRYRWGQWATKKMQENKNPKEEPHKKDDHCMDALRYGIMSRPQVDDGTEIPEWTPPVDMNISTAVNPVGMKDPYFEDKRDGIENPKYAAFDSMLGTEW